MGFTCGAGSVLCFLYAFAKITPSTESYLIASVIAITVGVFVSAMCHQFIQVSYFLLGFFAGYVTMNNVAIMFTQLQNSTSIFVVKIFLSICCGVLTLKSNIWTLVLASCLLGGFFVAYFSGFIFGLLGNLGDIIDRMVNGEKLGASVYIFLALYFALVGVGIFV